MGCALGSGWPSIRWAVPPRHDWGVQGTGNLVGEQNRGVLAGLVFPQMGSQEDQGELVVQVAPGGLVVVA